MRMRPVDADGDVLPVLSTSDFVYDAEAVALLVKDRLSLLYGEWWENTGLGFPVLRAMEESRLSEADAKSFASMITEYIRQTGGVKDVENVLFDVTGKRFAYSCTVRTEYGTANVAYETSL